MVSEIIHTLMNMNVFHIGLLLLWFASAGADYLFFTHLWQLKEYRIDRFTDFLHTVQGKRFKFSYRVFFRPLVLLFFYTFFASDISPHIFVGLLFIGDAIYNGFCYSNKRLKRPVFTIKALGLILFALIIEGFISVTFHGSNIVLVYFVLRFFLFSAMVQFIQWPTKAVKQAYIFFARRKMLRYPNITTIGITGSYGKSSVKEFASHILSGRYQVLKTPKNTNTEIGVAKFILSQSLENIDVFVCEMGAYKMGEIKKICDMVHPKIGILTAINEQHLTLFGAIEKTQQAKYELLRSIPEDGLIITNADNAYCTEFLDELICKEQLLFGMDPDNHPDLLINNISWNLEGGTYDVTCEEATYRVVVPTIGPHHAMNLVPAMAAAKFIGMSPADMITQATTLPRKTHGSLVMYQYGKATIIDDSYNSNPQGFCSALDVMAKFPSEKRRIVITRGMLELGERSTELHEQVGGEIAFVADGLVVTSQDSYAALKRGVGKKYHTQVSLKDDRKELLKYLKTLKDQEVVILLENRMPIEITRELSRYKQSAA